MANLLIEERDQQFVLNEMLEIEKLCESPKYADFSRDVFDMILNEAQRFGSWNRSPYLPNRTGRAADSKTARYPCRRHITVFTSFTVREDGGV